jgi:2-methylcitrate dehydratase PrpD
LFSLNSKDDTSIGLAGKEDLDMTVDSEEITRELIRNVLGTTFNDFSDEDIEDGKNQIIDLAAVTISGANASGNQALLDLVRQWGGNQEATIFVHGDSVPLQNAAMMNSLMARSYDHEATGPEPVGEEEGRMSGHCPSTTVPTAFSVSEYKRASGKDLISAVILGGDLAARMAVAEDFDFERSFDLVGTVNAFGAGAITGRLWGLNEDQMMNVFGILVNQVAGSFRCLWDGVHAFKYHGAMSARNAIVAVELALKGFTGVKDPLLGPLGYYPLYCRSYHPEFLTRNLGKVFYCKGQHKNHPSCTGNHNNIECGLELVQKYDINAEDIAEVILGVSEDRIGSFLDGPFKIDDSQPNALFNIPYGIANVLLRKSDNLEYYTEEFIHDPKVVELAGKVKMVATQPPEKSLAIELTVKMKDGREFSAYKDTPVKGWLRNPMSREEIKNKYWRNVDFSKTVSSKNAEKALAMIENLEEADDVSELIKLFVA